MALVGNFSEFRFAQVLNAIRATRKTGRLVVETEGRRAEFFFEDGRLAQAELSGTASSLQADLAEQGKIDDDTQNELQTIFGSLNDVGLALVLVDAGITKRETIEAHVAAGYVQIAEKLFSWDEGQFRFEPGDRILDRIPVSIGLERLIFNGNRKAAEWDAFKKEVPSLDIPVRLAAADKMSRNGITLTKEDWLFIAAVNGKSTLKEIGLAIGLDAFEIRRLGGKLIRMGLIQLVSGEDHLLAEAASVSTPQAETRDTLVLEPKPAHQGSFFQRISSRMRKN